MQLTLVKLPDLARGLETSSLPIQVARPDRLEQSKPRGRVKARDSGEKMAHSVDEYTEEMLLDDACEEQGIPVDTQCDKVLSRTMRTSDPVRNEVWESVQKEVALASECVKSLIEEAASDEGTVENGRAHRCPKYLGSCRQLAERNGPDLSALDDWDPHLLMSVAQRKLRQLKGKGIYVGHSDSRPLPLHLLNGKCTALFGRKSLTTIAVMDMEVEALLDAGSEISIIPIPVFIEISIIPIPVFKETRNKGIDLDVYVTRIPGLRAVVRNASGDVMNFVDTIRMDATCNNVTKEVSFHVGGGLGRLVILGTNALDMFGARLTAPDDRFLCHSDADHTNKPRVEPPSSVATVSDRTFVPPGA
ncbi:unnamed protein product [Heligmosomoides polygyrus]|uniref:Peptidase A2 domain-containing protein n=1 Tax=Heligmosomoides polygyrus TaxID=6339 RepID=A0A183FWZ4_HELPZ|nr:unnamed protein product [Heligmosomoides polygyrus]